MAGRVRQMLLDILNAFQSDDLKILSRIINADEEVDLLNSQFIQFLTHRAQGKLGTQSTEQEVRLLYGMDQLEHIGDLLSKDLVHLRRKKFYGDLEFSIQGQAELEEFHQMVYNLFESAFSAYSRQDEGLAGEVIIMCEEIRQYKMKMYLSHMEGVRKGIRENVSTTSIFLDLITDLERICDYSVNLAKVVLR